MRALRVWLNGKELGTIGVGKDGVVSVTVTWSGHGRLGDEGAYSLSLNGLDTAAGEHLTWPAPAVGTGDEVTIRLVEVDRATPAERTPAGDWQSSLPPN